MFHIVLSINSFLLFSERVIAMSFPSTGMMAMYRNSVNVRNSFISLQMYVSELYILIGFIRYMYVYHILCQINIKSTPNNQLFFVPGTMLVYKYALGNINLATNELLFFSESEKPQVHLHVTFN